ncbi:MAG TPA: hypothetical protein VKS01_09715 [Bryobacteraceae bacterium]|nr:hypothetical protein [Bryobacteraceae bacterium]
MDALVWLFLPVFVAGGSALLSFYIMQARMEVALSKERESLAEARATINAQKVTMEERIKATEESTKRHSLDEFMQDIRVEERSYIRESKSISSSKRLMVMQERLFFRNIPLSNWIEREMLVEEGLELNEMPKESIFQTATISSGSTNGNGNGSGRLAISKFLDDLPSHRPPVTIEKSKPEAGILVATRIPAFGAQ